MPATCYRFVAGPNKWEEAKDLCELAKGHLVSISSAAEKVRSFGALKEGPDVVCQFREMPMLHVSVALNFPCPLLNSRNLNIPCC